MILRSLLITGFIFSASVTAIAAQAVQISQASGSSVAASSLDRKVTLELRGVSILAALSEVTRQTGVQFGYARDIIPIGKRINLSARQVSVREVMTKLLAGTGLRLGATTGNSIAIVRESANQTAQG